MPTTATATARETALLLIDIQQGFTSSQQGGRAFSTPSLEENVTHLLASFRRARSPIFHVWHHSLFNSSPLHPSKPTVGVMPFATPQGSEKVFVKNVNSAFIGTSLEDAIRESRRAEPGDLRDHHGALREYLG